MYRVVATYNGVNYEIYNPLDPSAQIYDDEIAEEMGSTPAFSFTVPPGNIAETVIQPLATHITAYQGNVEVFSGRVISADWDLYNTMTVQCIGDMGDLADSQIAPFSHTGTAAQFLSKVIAKHNALVDASRAFTVGTVNVTGETGERAVEDYTDALTLITTYCSGAYGGYIRVRPGRVIDWMEDFGDNSQTIRFGENILDLTRQIDAADVATVLIALGPEPETGSRTVVTAQNAAGVAKWGKIYRVEEFESDTGLQAAAQARIDQLATMPESAELTALDLSVVDVSIPALTLGAWTNFYSPANGIQGSYLLYKRTLHMTAPANDTVSFGPVQQTITGTSLADKAEAKADNDALKEETQEMINSAMEGQDGKFSEINQTIDQIELRVGNAEGDISSLNVRANSIESQVENAEGDISNLQQTATSLTSRVSDAEDNISTVEQTADKINWVVQSGTSASNFTLTSHMAELVSDEVHIVTDDLQISSISYGGSCHVTCDSSGVSIYPGSGDVEIGNPASTIYLNGNRAYTGTLYPDGSPNAISGSGNAVFTGQLNANSGLFDDWCYAPSWENGSDEAIKREITALDTGKSKALILGLNPVSYYYKQGQSGAAMTVNAVMPMSRSAVSAALVPEEKLHFGFVAQEVQADLTAAGYTEGNPLVSSRQLTPDGDAVLTLNYTDLIAPLVKVVQDLAARVEALEGRNDNG